MLRRYLIDENDNRNNNIKAPHRSHFYEINQEIKKKLTDFLIKHFIFTRFILFYISPYVESILGSLEKSS